MRKTKYQLRRTKRKKRGQKNGRTTGRRQVTNAVIRQQCGSREYLSRFEFVSKPLARAFSISSKSAFFVRENSSNNLGSNFDEDDRSGGEFEGASDAAFDGFFVVPFDGCDGDDCWGTDGFDGVDAFCGCDGFNGCECCDGFAGFDGCDGVAGFGGSDGLGGCNGSDGLAGLDDGSESFGGCDDFAGFDSCDGCGCFDGVEDLGTIGNVDDFVTVAEVDVELEARCGGKTEEDDASPLLLSLVRSFACTINHSNCFETSTKADLHSIQVQLWTKQSLTRCDSLTQHEHRGEESKESPTLGTGYIYMVVHLLTFCISVNK